ncbi:MAG: phosphotransferase family protein [Sporichthyaceae bacterium]
MTSDRNAVADLYQQLTAFVGAKVGVGAPTLSGLARLGVGRSRENWIFDAQWPDGRINHLILRQDPPGGLVETDRATEFAVLQSLIGSGLKAPQALWLDAEARWVGRPSLVMVREPGTCEYDVVNGHRPAEVRLRLAREFCELMAAVHALDWRAAGLGEVLPDPGPNPALTELRSWTEILRRDQLEPYPELEFVIDALAATAPLCASPVLVHADFKPGNVLLEADRISALLDWELAHLGDPLEDLGWVTQPLRTKEHLIAGAWERADLIEHYERVRGVTVDPAAVSWWNTFASFKTAVMQTTGLRSFLEGRSDDLYRPTRGVLRAALAGAARLTKGDVHATHP